jgi:cyclohexa-1,5-dienecarbonyl-CoA hydratase
MNILVEKKDGIARLTLNRPPLNVLDIATMRELTAALCDAGADTRTRVVVLAAQGKVFSAGVDIQDHTAERVEEMLSVFHNLIRVVWALEPPTIAAAQGSALGGGMELAFACDFIVASEKAKFAQPEIQVGVFPPIAALALPHILPRKRAFEMILTGDAVDARTAERLGLVNVVAGPEEFENELNAFAGRLNKLSGTVLRMTKRAMQIPLRGENEQALREIEKLYLGELMQTADAQEGLAAFTEKRAARWKDG